MSPLLWKSILVVSYVIQSTRRSSEPRTLARAIESKFDYDRRIDAASSCQAVNIYAFGVAECRKTPCGWRRREMKRDERARSRGVLALEPWIDPLQHLRLIFPLFPSVLSVIRVPVVFFSIASFLFHHSQLSPLYLHSPSQH